MGATLGQFYTTLALINCDVALPGRTRLGIFIVNSGVAIWAGQRGTLALFSAAYVDVCLLAGHIVAGYFTSIMPVHVSECTWLARTHSIFCTTGVQIVYVAFVFCTVRIVVARLVAETVWADVLITIGQLITTILQVLCFSAKMGLASDVLVIVDKSIPMWTIKRCAFTLVHATCLPLFTSTRFIGTVHVLIAILENRSLRAFE